MTNGAQNVSGGNGAESLRFRPSPPPPSFAHWQATLARVGTNPVDSGLNAKPFNALAASDVGFNPVKSPKLSTKLVEASVRAAVDTAVAQRVTAPVAQAVEQAKSSVRAFANDQAQHMTGSTAFSIGAQVLGGYASTRGGQAVQQAAVRSANLAARSAEVIGAAASTKVGRYATKVGLASTAMFAAVQNNLVPLNQVAQVGDAVNTQMGRATRTYQAAAKQPPLPALPVPEAPAKNLPALHPRTAPGLPNTLTGGQEAPGPHRANWLWSGQGANAKTDQRVNIMNVPNLVLETGVKGASGLLKPINFTAQPLCFFIPVTAGNNEAKQYQTAFRDSALVHGFNHPAGFYPGDAKSLEQQDRFATGKAGDTEVAVEEFSMGGQRGDDQRNFQQTYLNAADMANPSSYSLNWRGVEARHQEKLYVSESSATTADGKQSALDVGAPYTWNQQPQFKVSLSVKGAMEELAKGPALHLGRQTEVGVYLWNKSYSAPQLLGQAPKAPTDWHVVNGKVVTDPGAWAMQSRVVGQGSGLEVRSQSVLPQAGDTKAPVFVRPLAGAGPGVALPSVTVPDVGAQVMHALTGRPLPQYVPVGAVAARLNEMGGRSNQYPELKAVAAGDLVALNAGKVRTYTDSAGRQQSAVPRDAWIKLPVSVAVGEPGLHLDRGR